MGSQLAMGSQLLMDNHLPVHSPLVMHVVAHALVRAAFTLT